MPRTTRASPTTSDRRVAAMIPNRKPRLVPIILGALAALAPARSALAQASVGSSPEAGMTIVVLNVHVIPMDYERVEAGQTVVIQGERIVAIGPAAEITVPDDATVIDGAGHYLLPGLTDGHVHLESWAGSRPDFGDAPLYLAHGITTAINLRGTPAFLALEPVLLGRQEVRFGKRGVRGMFAGFRSRCPIPFSCAASSASAICRASTIASGTGSVPCPPRRARRPDAARADEPAGGRVRRVRHHRGVRNGRDRRGRRRRGVRLPAYSWRNRQGAFAERIVVARGEVGRKPAARLYCSETNDDHITCQQRAEARLAGAPASVLGSVTMRRV
jgi:hypothetical protein